MPRTVEHFLGRSNAANLASKMSLGAGCSVAIWENQNDHVRYEAPHNHTLSLYLKGGTGTRRLDAGKISGWPGAVCILPAGQWSEWEITKPFRFVHLYLSDDRLRSMFSETHDCDARQLDLVEANFVDKPNVAQPLAELARAAVSDNMLHAESALAELIGMLPGREIHHLGGSRHMCCGGWRTILRRISQRQFILLTLRYWLTCPSFTFIGCSVSCVVIHLTHGLPGGEYVVRSSSYARTHQLQRLLLIVAFRARAI